MSEDNPTIEELHPLRIAKHQVHLSDRIQLADVLKWILAQTGKADVTITSFSISEEFLRRLVYLKHDGLVKSLNIVLDHKATNKTMMLWQMIRQVVEKCYLAENHSKILLVGGKEMKVAVITSQNLTRGNRYESIYITTDGSLYDYMSSRVAELITKSIPFDDLQRRPTETD